MGRLALGVGLLVTHAAACAPQPAKYPLWQPTPSTVPLVADRTQALADLEVSRQLWQKRGWEDYSYVSARQTSADEVELTWVVVHEGRVAARYLLSSPVDERGLGDRTTGKYGRAPLLLWKESKNELGRHADGAPAVTLDRLYDRCRDEVLSSRNEHLPRLSFHRDGLLQHCGFAVEACRDCPGLSVQTVGRATPAAWQSPSDVICTDRYGLFLDQQAPLISFGCEVCSCQAINRADPRAPALAPGESIGNICEIDPAACPPPRDGPPMDRASWSCVYLMTADGCHSGARVRELEPQCLALPRPTTAADPAWQHECR